jgi:hypothetical protein
VPKPGRRHQELKGRGTGGSFGIKRYDVCFGACERTMKNDERKWMKESKKSRPSRPRVPLPGSLDGLCDDEISAMSLEKFESYSYAKGGTGTPAGPQALPPGGKRSSLDLSGANEVGQDEEDVDQGRSKKGGEGILAAHQAERLRRGGSSFGEFKAKQLEEIAQAAAQTEAVEVSCGEAVRESLPYGLLNTLKDPTVVAADASEHRSRLAAEADVLEMAVDAAMSIGAQNSPEKMLGHQLAVMHKAVMHFAKLAFEQKDPGLACKLLKISMGATHSFQQGFDSLHRARRGGRQIVTVQRVNVNEGGKAVIASHVHEPAA